MANKPAQKFFLPDGQAVYPKTDRPYKYDKAAKRSVPDPDGMYKLEVALDAADAEPVIEQLKAFAKAEGLKSVKNWPWKEEVDKDTDEPTGRVIFKTKQYGKTREGATKRVLHADGAGRPLPKTFKLTSGSTVSVQVRPKTFKELGGGVKLSLEAIQVLRYVEYDNNPFKAREDAEFVNEPEDVEDDTPFDEEDDTTSATDF
jgi:hypothetical protein